MKYGICNLSVIPCRKEPADQSELVTQLLFGEAYSVLEVKEKWLKIKVLHDGYECFISANQHCEISEEEFQINEQQPVKPLVMDLFCLATNSETEQAFPIIMGSVLPQFNNGAALLANTPFQLDGAFHIPAKLPNRNVLIETAYMYLNAPYLWGGRTPLGIDCSGFSQIVYRSVGINLPRDAYQQAEKGVTLSFVEESEPGDLAFFDNDEGKIIHVGIILPDNYIVHASGSVRIDRIDHQGIYNVSTKKYSHKLRLIKKII